MKLTVLKLKQPLNKAYLKESLKEEAFTRFKKALVDFLDNINENEREEHQKNHTSDFLKAAYYRDLFAINTKDNDDLVIHLGKSTHDPVGVLCENKKINSTDMMTVEKPNVKSFQQLILYYFEEKIGCNNDDIKNLIVTDTYRWFIFNANDFDKHIFLDTKLRKGYNTFVNDGKVVDFFYKSIAKPRLDELDFELACTYFDMRKFHPKNTSDKELMPLFKILSPTHLLKVPFANDSNQLDKTFYTELLYIIGLEEVKEGSKKIISRKQKPENGSLLENTISNLDGRPLQRIRDISKYGDTQANRIYNIALELCITWVNRILFLKLLEAQLVKYHKGDQDYLFLNKKTVHDFDELNKLFFKVLAEQTGNRRDDIQKKYSRVPYLNSSLFERTELENDILEISNLENNIELPLTPSTVLKDEKGKRLVGSLKTLEYFFEFLNAYNFASEDDGEILAHDKTLINAAVLGLIFEKINGYKDGSFFTPGFITMYMCRETIRRAIVQKFSENGFIATSFDALKEEITDRKKANDIINSLKICDPAVGSGHFLVSALNEIMVVKSDLDVLMYRDGKRVKNYKVEVQNDELIVTDEGNGDIFQYTVNAQGIAPREVQQLQETLFHEKQTIIENCLFGVDINPNSVKICRLRLWIELLKNAYYKTGTDTGVLETLPNIDINIKQGNSLISRFKLNDDLSDVFKKQKTGYKAYRKAVEDYKNTNSKATKAELFDFISEVKSAFQTLFRVNIKENKELAKFRGQLSILQNQGLLFGGGTTDKIEEDRLEKLVALYEQKVNDIKDNIVYRDAFEWRFEFPEVLDNDGNFVGFDVVIGNPPYLTGSAGGNSVFLKSNFKTAQYQLDLYVLFMENGMNLLNANGLISYITPNSWLKNLMMSNIRLFMLQNLAFKTLNPNIANVFSEAQVDTMIFIGQKEINSNENLEIIEFKNEEILVKRTIEQKRFLENDKYVFDVEVDDNIGLILKKIRNKNKILNDIMNISFGFRAYDLYAGQTKEIIENKLYTSDFEKDSSFETYVAGKHISKYNYQIDNKHFIKWGVWLAAPRDERFFKRKRIVLREILGETFVCTMISEELKIDRSLYIALPKNENINVEYVLGILASRMLAWFFKYEKNEFDLLFPKIRLEEFKNLPIKFGSEEIQKEISDLVTQILAIKKSDANVSTTALETEIDKLVYNLYGLTEEEIKIVELKK